MSEGTKLYCHGKQTGKALAKGMFGHIRKGSIVPKVVKKGWKSNAERS